MEAIRNRALEKARVICPEAEFAIDRRPMDDYLERVWDYPGVWYVGFRLPKGFKSEEQLVAAIFEDTVEYYSDKRK